MIRRKLPNQAACGRCCGIKEKLQTLWDRAIGCINRINNTTPDGDGNFTVSGGPGIVVTEADNGIEISAASVSYTGVDPIVVDNDTLEISAPTAVVQDDLNDYVTKDTAQNIPGSKSFVPASGSGTVVTGIDAGDSSTARTNGTFVIKTNAGDRAYLNNYEDASNVITQVTSLGNVAQNLEIISNKASNEGFAKCPYRPYNAANVYDIQTIGSAAANPNLLHTVGSETKYGTMAFNNNLVQNDTGYLKGDKNNNTGSSEVYQRSYMIFQTLDGADLGAFNIVQRNGATKIFIRVKNSDGTWKDVALGQGNGY